MTWLINGRPTTVAKFSWMIISIIIHYTSIVRSKPLSLAHPRAVSSYHCMAWGQTYFFGGGELCRWPRRRQNRWEWRQGRPYWWLYSRKLSFATMIFKSLRTFCVSLLLCSLNFSTLLPYLLLWFSFFGYLLDFDWYMRALWYVYTMFLIFLVVHISE